MQIGIIGLGRMGANIARRLMRAGHACGRSTIAIPTPGAQLAGEGAVAAASLADLVARMLAPRAQSGSCCRPAPPPRRPSPNWPDCCSPAIPSSTAATPSGRTISAARRHCATKRLHYVDVGTSGGVWGLERGYCLMIGGDKATVDRLDPIFKALAPGKGDIPATAKRDGRDPRAEQGYIHAGPNGAGHFVKMIHNGIEYGMMQAMAEGFDILKHANSPKLPEEHAPRP